MVQKKWKKWHTSHSHMSLSHTVFRGDLSAQTTETVTFIFSSHVF
jgi:hypothetical protein